MIRDGLNFEIIVTLPIVEEMYLLFSGCRLLLYFIFFRSLFFLYNRPLVFLFELIYIFHFAAFKPGNAIWALSIVEGLAMTYSC